MAAVFVCYYLIPKNRQWYLLLLASYIFYAFASPIFLVFLIAVTLLTYCGAILMASNFQKMTYFLENNGKNISKEEKKQYKLHNQKCQKRILAFVTVALLCMLLIFKYATFFLKNVSFFMGVLGVANQELTLNIIMPLGLSFYMFQGLGYCIDVYREMVQPERNFLKYALFISYFPQLLQGPIGDYNRLSPQLFIGHDFSYEETKFGLQRVAWGFFKKLVIANQISLIIDTVWAEYNQHVGFCFWIFVLVLYAFQLYADFSGYMDIALGCSQMLGIQLDENFDLPYFSKSIAEFWRRWHISLGAWFKNYVFYSVLRSKWCDEIRKKNKKTHPYISNTLPNVIALVVVWCLIGLWHGADWSYVVYGMYHGFFIVASTVLAPVYSWLEKRYEGIITNKVYSLFQVFRTFGIVTIGYLIFRPANLSVSFEIVGLMLSKLGYSEMKGLIWQNQASFVKIAFGISALAIVDAWHFYNQDNLLRRKIANSSFFIRWGLYISLLLCIIYFGAYGTESLNQFAYFVF